MSKLSDLQARMGSLEEIVSILNAMKNLSLVEITKVSRLYLNQQELLQAAEFAIADFQRFFGTAGSETPDGPSLYILIGSERGFCGGFNEAIQQKSASEGASQAKAKLIVVGRKLALKFAGDARVVVALDGPNTTEEISSVISALAGELARFGGTNWKIVYNSYSNEGARVEVKSPFDFAKPGANPHFDFPPLLNLPASELRPQLFEQYLFALFHGIFYLSFMAENHERLRHMDGALNKIREEEQRLKQLWNSLRQETITEELELIMLNVVDPAGPSTV